MSYEKSVKWQGVTYSKSQIGAKAYGAVLAAEKLLKDDDEFNAKGNVVNDEKMHNAHEALAIMISAYGEAFAINYINNLLS